MGIATNALAAVPSGDRDQARAASTSLFISYASKRHKPPFSSVGDAEKRAMAHVAAYDLLSRRGYKPNAEGDDPIKGRYESALAWLKMGAQGLIEFEIVDSTPGTVEASPLVSSDPSAFDPYGNGTGWGF
jgi:phage gp36-like protein